MTNETLTERVDAISQVIYDPSGKQSGEYYPANSTHFFGKPIRRRVTKAVVKPPQAVEGARLSPELSFVDSKEIAIALRNSKSLRIKKIQILQKSPRRLRIVAR